MTSAALILVAPLLSSPAQGDAEDIFRECRKQFREAKTLQFKFTSVTTLGDREDKTVGTVHLGQDNKARIALRRERPGSTYTEEMISSGAKMIRIHSRDGRRQLLDAPKTLIGDCRFLLLRLGANEDRLGKIFRGRYLKSRHRLTGMQVSEFRRGAREKVGDREAQEIRYTLGYEGRGGGLEMRLWIDLETKLPLKRIVTIKGRPGIPPIVERYTEFRLNEKLAPVLFEILE